MKTMIRRYTTAVVSLCLAAPAFAHTGDHGDVGVAGTLSHLLAHADHLAPLLALMAIALVVIALRAGASSRRSADKENGYGDRYRYRVPSPRTAGSLCVRSTFAHLALDQRAVYRRVVYHGLVHCQSTTDDAGRGQRSFPHGLYPLRALRVGIYLSYRLRLQDLLGA